MGNIVSMGRCAKCGSSDALATYDDGSTYCWSGNHPGRKDTQPTGKQREEEPMTGTITMAEVGNLPINPLTMRGISQAAAEHYGVRTEYDPETGEEAAYYAPLYKNGQLKAWQVKPANAPGKRKGTRKPYRLGESGGVLPFGAQRASQGFVIVCEGVEDVLATYDLLALNGKQTYSVVATLGTDGWKRQLEWFSNCQKIIIAFDQDGAGKQAAAEFAQALKPGQAKIARWSEHPAVADPNGMLYYAKDKKAAADALLSAINKAEDYRPGGIITGEEAWNIIRDYTAPESVPYPPEFEILNQKSEGMRRGEISMWTAGSGIGKSAFIRRMKQHLILNTAWTVGDVELEESVPKTIRAMLQWQGGKLLRDMTEEEKRAAWEVTYGTQRIITVDHRSQLGRKGDGLMGKLRYLHHAHGADILFVDHVTIAVSELGEGQEGNSAVDRMMDGFLQFVESTNTHICLISHLRKSPGGNKTWAQGAVPSEEDMKGSGSLYQIAADVIAVSRNKQHEDEYQRNVSQLTALKLRETGDTGPCDRLHFSREDYSLTPAKDDTEEKEPVELIDGQF